MSKIFKNHEYNHDTSNSNNIRPIISRKLSLQKLFHVEKHSSNVKELQSIWELIFSSKPSEALNKCNMLLEDIKLSGKDFGEKAKLIYLKAKCLSELKHSGSASDSIKLIDSVINEISHNTVKAREYLAQFYSLKSSQLIYQGLYHQALKAAEDATKLDHTNLDSYLFKGIALTELHQDLAAKEIFIMGKAVGDLNYVNPQTQRIEYLRQLISKAVLEQKLETKQQDASEELIKNLPNYDTSFLIKAVRLLNTDDYDQIKKALILVDTAITLNSQNSLALYHKGLIIEKIGKTNTAKTYFDKAKTDHDNEKAVIKSINYLRSNKLFDEALEEAKIFLSRHPDAETILLNKFEILLHQKKYQEAEIVIQQLLKIEPENSLYLYNEANMHIEDKKFFDAIDVLTKINHGEKDSHLFYQGLGNALSAIAQEEKKVGVEYYKKYIALEAPKEVVQLIKIKAIECFDKAIEFDKNNFKLYLDKAMALYNFQQYKNFIECINDTINHFDTRKVDDIRHIVLKQLIYLIEIAEDFSPNSLIVEEMKRLSSGYISDTYMESDTIENIEAIPTNLPKNSLKANINSLLTKSETELIEESSRESSIKISHRSNSAAEKGDFTYGDIDVSKHVSHKSAQAIKISLSTLKNDLTSQAELTNLMEQVTLLTQDINDIRCDIGNLPTRTELGSTIKASSELEEANDKKKKIEEDDILFAYYSSFLRIVKTTWIALQAQNSGEVGTSSSLVNVSDYLPPIADQVTKAVETIISAGVKIKKMNDTAKAMKIGGHIDMDPLFEKLAIKLTLAKKSDLTEAVEPDTIWNKILLKLNNIKSKIFEDETPLIYQKIGAADAAKFLSAMKLGYFDRIKLTNQSSFVHKAKKLILDTECEKDLIDKISDAIGINLKSPLNTPQKSSFKIVNEIGLKIKHNSTIEEKTIKDTSFELSEGRERASTISSSAALANTTKITKKDHKAHSDHESLSLKNFFKNFFHPKKSNDASHVKPTSELQDTLPLEEAHLPQSANAIGDNHDMFSDI